MIQPIFLYGSSVLKEVAEPADISDRESLSKLIEDMKETLVKAEGCGLAAPQIGRSVRVLIVDGTGMTDTYPYLADFKRVMVNPVVKSESSSHAIFQEGCLSVPGVYCDVRRPESITVEYYDENFEKVEETFDKFGCRMVQHEMSHLDGTLFVDLVAPVRKKIISKKLQSIAKGRVSARYNTKVQ